jgi:oligopeptide/dipeptide ABC transporter ATP-binding protein
MYAGRVAEIGVTGDLFRNPRHPYTQALLRSIPSLDQEADRLPTLRGTVPDPGAMPPGCRFFERCEYARPPCRATLPDLLPAGEDHAVACLRDFGYQIPTSRCAP